MIIIKDFVNKNYFNKINLKLEKNIYGFNFNYLETKTFIDIFYLKEKKVSGDILIDEKSIFNLEKKEKKFYLKNLSKPINFDKINLSIFEIFNFLGDKKDIFEKINKELSFFNLDTKIMEKYKNLDNLSKEYLKLISIYFFKSKINFYQPLFLDQKILDYILLKNKNKKTFIFTENKKTQEILTKNLIEIINL
jgi:hypothetical protein